jgi:hypothetical protein
VSQAAQSEMEMGESERLTSSEPTRFRDKVYVIGAGFSAGLGYPLTKSLLIDVWSRLEPAARVRLQKIIEFHHPGFKLVRKTSFPDIEQLLTEIAVNIDLFDASRPAEGRFKKDSLTQSREDLLSAIATWFHELYDTACRTSWLSTFVLRLQRENAAIVSFNWDLVLDQQLFSRGLSSKSYGLSDRLADGPVLLQPHGSLNWYDTTQIEKVSEDAHIEIFPNHSVDERIEAFVHPREIKSKVGRHYTPLIIPPTFLKDFNRPIFRQLWRRCTDILSTAKELIFLGYSLPPADLHAQFIFRCGFHSQLKGRLKEEGGIDRYNSTGPANVTIVNPDQDAARRIEAVAGPGILCNWVPKRIQDWLEDEAR